MAGITDSVDMRSKFWKIVKESEALRVAVHGVTNSRILVSN